MSLVSSEVEGGMDASCGSPCEVTTRIVFVGSAEDEGVDPEVPVDLAIGVNETLGEGVDLLAVVGEDVVAVAEEGPEEVISGVGALLQKRGRDGVGLVDVVQVPDDAEEIAGVDPVGEGAALLLGLEDGA